MKPRDNSMTWYPNIVVLYIDEVRQDHTELYYPTMSKAREIASYLNSLMPERLKRTQCYVAEKNYE
jgi:hypothetical protein